MINDRDFTAIRRPDGQQKLRDRVKVISREAKREMLAEKVVGMWGEMGNTYRDRIGGIFSSGSSRQT